MPFRLPRDDEHTAVVGRNGSGKSQLGAWLLSKHNLKSRPWIVYDFKGEELFNSVERIRPITHREVPTEPGLYLLSLTPSEQDETESHMWKVWAQENIGVFVDEGYMIPQPHKGGAFRSLLTQGRSKRIPMIVLSQRPVAIDRFVFSEASHVAVFHLNDKRDTDIVSMFTPPGFSEWTPEGMTGPDGQILEPGKLPRYHSRWYNIKDDEKYLLRPVPGSDIIVNDINSQLEPKRRII